MTVHETFQKYQDVMSKRHNWKDSTTADYSSTMKKYDKFVKQVAPGVDFQDLTFADFEAAMDAQRKASKRMALSTITKKRGILYYICMQEEENNPQYQNPIWGSYWRYKSEKIRQKATKANRQKVLRQEREAEIQELVKPPKSLTVLAESKLAKLLREKVLHADTDGGEAMGGLLMLYLGLRPGECCAIKYGNINELIAGSGRYILYVYEQIDTKNKIRSTLKTKNAYRILPIPQELMKLLDERKAFIQRVLPSGKDVLACPIVNAQNNVTAHCTRLAFSRAITRMLREVKVEEKTISYASAEMRNKKDIEEKEATSYLLRRNFATIMSSVCRMDEGELQYLMGHELTNGKKRRDYIDPEVLTEIGDKMEQRHLLDVSKGKSDSLSQLDTPLVSISSLELAVTGKDLQNAAHNWITLDIYDDCPADRLTLELHTIVGETTTRILPAVLVECDYRETKPQAIGRIDTSAAYCKALRQSANMSKSKGANSETVGANSENAGSNNESVETNDEYEDTVQETT